MLIFLFGCLPSAYSQTGNYYITNYTPANYSSTDQNRGIVQDKFGRINAANLSGVLNYDGEYWKITFLPKERSCTSIQADQNGVLFIGGDAEFGYIGNSSKGKYEYHSLMNQLKEDEKDFSYIWSTLCFNNNVYFGSNKRLIVYDYNKLKTISAPEDSLFHTYFNVDNNLFVRQYEVGFKVYTNGKLEFVEGSEMFAQIKVRFILPKDKGTFWVGTENGMYQLNLNKLIPTKSTFTKFNCAIDNWMIENQVYCGKKLRNGSYIIGSQKDGILHIDENLNIIKSINFKSGLQDENVSSIYEDNSGNIWLSLNKGISYIELNTPITNWTKYDGIKGTIETTCKFKNNIFIGTDKGLQLYNKANNKFELTSITSSVWDLCVSGDKLIIATVEGVYIFDGSNYTLAFENGISYKILTDQKDPSVIYIGGEFLIFKAKLIGNKIELIQEFEAGGTVRSILQKGDFIYFSINGVGVDVLNLNTNKIITYAEKEGLKSLEDNTLFEFNKQILVGTGNGIYELTKENKFVRNPNLNFFPELYQISKPTVIFDEIFFQGTGDLENIAKVDEISSLKLVNGKLVGDKKSLRRIRDVNAKNFYLSDSLVYISTNDGLFCYDLNFKKVNESFSTYISSIICREDTFFHNISENVVDYFKIQYSQNLLHFDLSANNYIDKHEMEFAYYLEGTDTSYGKWTKNNTASFNNLHEGKYVFHAKSRDVLGKEGKEITFAFTVMAPWYRTTLAYIIYFILFVIVVWIIVALNTKRLRAQNIKLENTITERTKTIAHQMVEIEHKNKEITDSINYAKGIQDSILPDVKDIKNTWKDTFVYFQPKDIVSGDFFWYKKINDNEFLIACADCTGHGVPGGFMSMICSDKLHDSAKESNQPKDILFGTNNGVKTTLKQEIIVEGKSKDGMEVCLLKVNTLTQEINYSGANRLLWIVDGETKELTEIKPTKASIASFTEFNFEYQQHDFKLKKGDIVYATSDGFPDQFGGGEGKKYMSKKMKAFILSICELPMDEQHDLLKKEINDWMMGHEQVDDLLVIGVRL